MHTKVTLAALLPGAVLLAALAGPAAAQWVTFSSSSDEGATGSGGQGAGHGFSPVRGFLSLPTEAGRRPAVVMLPSCEGHRAYQQTWARALSERGLVALVVDDYFMHDRGRTCGLPEPAARADLLRMRMQHALGAARYLSSRPEVDAGRLAVMGWGDAPVGALLGDAEGATWGVEAFRAGVMVTPTECGDLERSPSRPMLVLRAEPGASPGRDGACVALVETSEVEVRTYEGARRGFDNPRTGRRERSKPGTAGAYDRLAHARAIEDVAEFLIRRLAPAPSDGEHRYAPAPTSVVPEVGTWAVDPDEAGPDLPPAGSSAFDAVFSRLGPQGAVHDVPFPFSRLLRRLEQAAGGESMSRSPLDATLIPLGRSLQREAAAPDYFESPRIVVAVTGGPASGAGPLGIPLEDRLFLGYQPRAGIVEVISYNEAARRFEFQVVREYVADREPEVRYARRALCTSCHQNGGPIFADASWDETTANPRVARRLAGLGERFHGVPVADVDRAVTAIDTATDEANLLPVYQRLWSEGCASESPDEVARCRAGALQAMLQYRLSGSAGFDRGAALYAEGYLPLQRRNWSRRWPDGLLVPSPNLPNRAPLMSPSPSVVSAALDPLRRRPPMARWEASSERDLDRLVRGLSHYLPDRHMVLLARHLREAGEGAPGHALAAPCEVIRRGFAGRPRLFQVECRSEARARIPFRLKAQLRVTPEGTAEGEAGWMEIGEGTYARRTMAGRVEAGRAGPRMVLRLTGGDGEAFTRAPDGNAILDFVLGWDAEVTESATRFDATGTLAIGADYLPVASALTRLATGNSESSPLLAEDFDGAGLSGWLLAELGALAAPPQRVARPTPAPRLDADTASAESVLSVALEHRGPLLTFRRYCGACHGGDTINPPGFLRSGDSVLGSVAQCAERIYYRLSMWRRAPEHQGVPPMPPAQGLRLVDTTADDWRRSEALERLTAYARELLVAEGRDPGAVLDGSYHDARACLAKRGERDAASAAPPTGG